MKHKCKNIDITDHDFILRAIYECNSQKTKKEMQRHDIQRLYKKCHNEDGIANYLRDKIVNRNLDLPNVRYDIRIDKSNGKIRILAIEDIEQQYLDYIAHNALDELESYIGHYQIACEKGQGPLYGARIIQQWIKELDVNYVIKADVKKCYPSIRHAEMIAWLQAHVKNDPLIWLISELLKHMENGDYTVFLKKCMRANPKNRERVEKAKKGLPIGSYLSIRLCALYLADVYHHCEGNYFVTRRKKKRNIFKHIMFNMDDMYFFGSNAKAMSRAMRDTIKFASAKNLTIKSDWQMITLSKKDKDAHIDALGYRVYRDRITMRSRNYHKIRRAMGNFKSHTNIDNARSLMARYGMFIKDINSFRFCQKYNVYPKLRLARKVISDYDKSEI